MHYLPNTGKIKEMGIEKLRMWTLAAAGRLMKTDTHSFRERWRSRKAIPTPGD